MGAVVIDSDRLAREVVAVGTPGLAAIGQRFGDGVVAPDGSLNRAALASIVFNDPGARLDLNAITHPLVRARFAELALAAPPGAIVVNDIPILTELAVTAQFHLVVGIGADAEIRVRRLIGRGLTEVDARARIGSQIDDAARRPLTDAWLDNSGEPDLLLMGVDELWRSRLIPFNANVIGGVRAVRSAPLLVAPDPGWPSAASRMLARVAAAVGAAALSLDHIGSTAIPHMPAKDVVDLQLGVTSLEVAEQISAPLTRAGFIRQPGQWFDSPHPADAAPEDWYKTFHANADPGRSVNLHVRVAGSPGWRFALLFRDWLRADPSAAAEYLGVKRAASAEFAGDVDAERYTRAKEPWFERAWQRSQAWAELTGWQPGASERRRIRGSTDPGR